MAQPTCRTCGSALRWFPDHPGWGCDQCRVMLPLAAPSSTQTSLVAPKGQSNLPVIAGALASIAAGVGIAIALVGTGGGSEPAAVAPTPGSGSGSAGPVAPSGARPGSAGAGSATATAPAPKREALTEGPPELSSVADLWLYPRPDGSVRVASPLFEITFPRRPVITVKRDPVNKTSDGKPFDIYQLADDTAGGGMRHLELIAFGRNAKLTGPSDAVKTSFAKLGTVKESTRVELGIPITELEVVDKTGGRLRTRMSQDLPRGVLLSLTTLAIAGSKDEAVDDGVRASLHLRAPKEPGDDPTVLARVAVTRQGKKFVVRDAARTFSVTLPWTGKVVRTAKNGGVLAAITATKKAARIQIDIGELPAGDAVRRAPAWLADDTASAMATLAKLTGASYTSVPWKVGSLDGVKLAPRGKLPRKAKRVEVWTVFDRGWRRLYMLTCFDTPCDTVARSLTLAPPVPVP